MNYYGGTHSGDYDIELDTEQETDMDNGKPLIEPGPGESEDGLFFEPAKTIAKVKSIIGAGVTLLGTLGITFTAGDTEVITAVENVASLGIGLVAAVLVAWNALSQGVRTRDAVYSPNTVSKLTKGQGG